MKKAGRVAIILRKSFLTEVKRMQSFLAIGNILLLDLHGSYMGNHFTMNYSTHPVCSVLIQNSVCLAAIREIFSH